MKLGIMQPYFFPYLGHFALIAAVDKWIVFDVTQYTKRTWMNRNRVFAKDGSVQYISAPLHRSSRQLKTYEAELDDPQSILKSLLGKIDHYKKLAPYFKEVKELIEDAFSRMKSRMLVECNVASLQVVCGYLGLNFDYEICSRLGFDFPDSMGPGDWAPWIAKELRAESYLNPAGGIHLFKPADFLDSGIQLLELDFEPFEYKTIGYPFVPGLSILDVLMWNTPSEVVQAIKLNSKITAVV